MPLTACVQGRKGPGLPRLEPGQGRRCELGVQEGAVAPGVWGSCACQNLCCVGTGWAESGTMPSPPKDRPVHCSLSWSAARVPKELCWVSKGIYVTAGYVKY